MEVNKVIKTKDCNVKFEGELSQEEHEFVLTVGLHTLMQQGAIPFIVADDSQTIIPGNGELQ